MRYLERLVELEAFRKTIIGLASAIALALIGFGVWIVTSLHDVKTSVAVSATESKNISTQISRVSDDLRRLTDETSGERESRQKLSISLTRLETIVERLEDANPTPTPR